MTYLDDLASEIERRIPRDLVPEVTSALLFRLYALLALVKGTAVTASDVHNAWAVWMREQDPDHRSIKPFEELDVEMQAFDDPFVLAIRVVAESRI